MFGVCGRAFRGGRIRKIHISEWPGRARCWATRRWWRLRVDAGHKAKSMPLCACVCVCVGMEFVYTYTQCIHTQVCVCVCVCVCIYVCVVYTQNTESGATACINSRPSTSTSAATSHGYSIITANGTLMFLRWPRVLMNSMKLDETWRMKPPPRQCVSGVSHMYTLEYCSK